MGGERGHDVHVVQNTLDGLCVGLVLGEGLCGRAKAVFERPVLGSFADGPHALAFFGEVDEFEVGGERPRDVARQFGRKLVEFLAEHVAGFRVSGAVVDGPRSSGFDHLERLPRGEAR